MTKDGENRGRIEGVTLLTLALVLGGWARAQEPTTAAGRLASIQPDYSGIVIPPNIAPLNFRIAETGTRFRVRIESTHGSAISLESRQPEIRIPLKPWRTLLEANAGQPLRVEIAVRDAGGAWTRYGSMSNTIAVEPIDGYLVYRWLRPLYSRYREMEIRQRDLSSFDVRPLVRNSAFDRGCCNCHSFDRHRPETMALNIRSQNDGRPLLVARDGAVTRVEHTAGYLAWHPGGRRMAFSSNKLSLFYHTTGEPRDVFDAHSDILLLDFDRNRLVHPGPTTLPDVLENWPAWSPAGDYLYFCRARRLTLPRFRQIRYDLARVSFDSASNTFGSVETLLAADETGLSAAQPKISPDGRRLMFCLSDYGNFPVYQRSSDLYLMNLETREYRRLEINSDQTESWHGWSRNSRWIVFSSKRHNGTFAHPHFSYVDAGGRVHKPFVLPQRDPTFYETCLHTFNVPELISGPVTLPENAWTRAIRRPRIVLTPTADPTDLGGVPASPAGPDTQEDDYYTPQ